MKTRLLKRCSVRSFKEKQFSQKTINEIMNIINSSPTSSNSHQFSACVITDKDIKNKIADLSGNQKQISEASVFVVFNVDLTSIHQCIDNFDDKLKLNAFMISMTDLTISATMLQDWALLNKYGTCYIGALRRNIPGMQEILKLPKHIAPVLGLCIGVPNQKLCYKPKLNKVFLNDTYNNVEYGKRMDEYDQIMFDYYNQKHPEQASIAFYNHNRRTYNPQDIRNTSVDYEFINDIINIVFKDSK